MPASQLSGLTYPRGKLRIALCGTVKLRVSVFWSRSNCVSANAFVKKMQRCASGSAPPFA